MANRDIVIDPGAFVDRGDLARRTEQTVLENSNVTETLEAASSPLVFISSNRSWSDEYLAGLSQRDWVTTTGAGYDAFPLDQFRERDVRFTNQPGNNAPQVAEHAIAMLLSITRRLFQFRTQQQHREWKRISEGMTHHSGDVCCVVGLGHIGEAIAKRLGAFGMTVRGVKRSASNYSGNADSVYPPTSLHDALSEAGVVMLSVPLTDETHHMIGKSELDQTRSDAVIVNVGRGPVLETEAIVAAIEDRSVRAACLDVTDPEPLPSDSPLWTYENIFITAHSASRSDKRTGQFLDEFLPAFERWCTSDQLEHRIV
ncbi:D-2-hydroxyacid dehydrogenase [Natrarchaeobius chitinivorans]|nr:D-2-hydroxyacid dehydrogenase [Natrarchaeobius chitinivorans]